jgi:hypothetical protein
MSMLISQRAPLGWPLIGASAKSEAWNRSSSVRCYGLVSIVSVSKQVIGSGAFKKYDMFQVERDSHTEPG